MARSFYWCRSNYDWHNIEAKWQYQTCVYIQIAEFTKSIHECLGPAATADDFEDELEEFYTPTFEPYEDKETKPLVIPERDETQHFDQYIRAEVLLPSGNSMKSGKVKRRKRLPDGSLKGTSISTPLFDSRAHIIEFPDGTVAEYTANIIAENMYAQCNLDGEQYLILKGIVDHKKDGQAVENPDAYVWHNGRKQLKKTT